MPTPTYANIVHADPAHAVVQSFASHPLFAYIRFWPDYDDPALDTRLPTLYVGYREVKQRFARQLRVLEPRLGPLAWWVAAPGEDALRFLSGFQAFLGAIAPALVQALTVVRTDPFFGPARTGEQLLALLGETELLVGYSHEQVHYLYAAPGQVLVVDEVLYAACGLSPERLQAEVAARCPRCYADETRGPIHQFFTAKFDYPPAEVSRYIPYLIWVKLRPAPEVSPARALAPI